MFLRFTNITLQKDKKKHKRIRSPPNYFHCLLSESNRSYVISVYLKTLVDVRRGLASALLYSALPRSCAHENLNTVTDVLGILGEACYSPYFFI